MRLLLKITFLLGLMIGTIKAQECPPQAPYFCITPEMAPNSEITQSDFYLIPAKVLSLFQSHIVLNAQWSSPYFGMGMSNPKSMMILGGTTRVPGMTLHAYAAAVCHEVGHVLGGAPYQTMQGFEWSSAEGQADYFAASVCLPRYFESLGYKKEEIADQVEKAGYELLSSLSPYSSDTKNQPLERFKKEEQKTSSTLFNNYPSIQCRYETFRNKEVRSNCWFKE